MKNLHNIAVGDPVHHTITGMVGVVAEINNDDIYCLSVKWKDGDTAWYTLDGKQDYEHLNPVVYYGPPIAQTEFPLKGFIRPKRVWGWRK